MLPLIGPSKSVKHANPQTTTQSKTKDIDAGCLKFRALHSDSRRIMAATHVRIPKPWIRVLLGIISVFCVFAMLRYQAEPLPPFSNNASEDTDAECSSFLQLVNDTTGGLNVNKWFDLCGTGIHQLQQTPLYPSYPNQAFHVWHFASAKNEDKQFGQRIFGFVKPPLSGYYQFAISSDDTSELWLSLDQNPANVGLVASVSSLNTSAWTTYGDYKKHPSQMSRELFLEANKSYFIEALHKQGFGDSHLEVYWKLPGWSCFEIIRGIYLSPFYTDLNEMRQTSVYGGDVLTKQRNETRLENQFLGNSALPYADEKDIDRALPNCHYEPSFIVRGPLKKYAGVLLIHPASVFPEDETAFKSTTESWSLGNEVVQEGRVQFVVQKFVKALEKQHPGKYSLQKIIRVEQTVDQKKGDRFLLELQLGLRAHSNASVRFSRYVFLERGGNQLCFPEGYNWHRNAYIYFILPVKNQGGWLHHFISEITRLYDKTRDDNFVVIVIDFASDDVDVAKMIKSSPIAQKITLIKKSGPFHKTLAIQEAAKTVPSPRDIVFLFDLHIDVPLNLLESVRKHTIQGKMAYSPVVGRLDCGRFRDNPDGFWQTNGFGIMAVYKSDWDRFGGMNMKDFTTKWGGEDWDLVDRILGSRLEIFQLKQPGLLHYYHTHNGMWNSTSR